MPARGAANGGAYIVQYFLRGYRDCIDVEVVPATVVSASLVTCRTPDFLPHTAVSVELSLNGGADYSRLAPPLCVFNAPSLRRLEPASGRRHGGTRVELHSCHLINSFMYQLG